MGYETGYKIGHKKSQKENWSHMICRHSAAVFFGVLGVVGTWSAQAEDIQQVQVSSLEVKSRIASIEQVNVTAEKRLDEDAPAPAAVVADLLAELEALEAAPTQKDEK